MSDIWLSLEKREVCECTHPYLGTQLVGTPPRCEACGGELRAEEKAIEEFLGERFNG